MLVVCGIGLGNELLAVDEVVLGFGSVVAAAVSAAHTRELDVIREAGQNESAATVLGDDCLCGLVNCGCALRGDLKQESLLIGRGNRADIVVDEEYHRILCVAGIHGEHSSAHVACGTAVVRLGDITCDICVLRLGHVTAEISVLTARDGARVLVCVGEPIGKIRGFTVKSVLTARIPTLLGVSEARIVDYKSVMGDSCLVEVLGVRVAVIVVASAVGGEHTLVVYLERARVKMLVVRGGALLDSHKHRRGCGIVPGCADNVLTERRAVILNEIHTLVSVRRGLDVCRSGECEEYGS